MTVYKFVKHKSGITSFAAIALELTQGSDVLIEWAAPVKALEPIYGEAVTNGVRDALAWHVAEGGAPTTFRVLELTELLVDTKPDAVRCAATMAAWIALGRDENSVTFEFNNEWKAIYLGL